MSLKNNSSRAWTFYVYQVQPNAGIDNVFPLAWLASPYSIAPSAQITFNWNTNYGFIWDEVGVVMPGVTFSASECVPGGLLENNTIKFSCSNNTPRFEAALTGNPAGSLVISTDQTVPNQVFSVGISMSGAGTFVTQAGPNLTSVFTPPSTPRYWVAAGTGVHAGTVLDATDVNQSFEVIFPVNVYEVALSLGMDNVWRQG
ncbi:hypothetical protein [Pseudomonas gingeri]